jgi:hypothetical protein
MSTSHFSLQLKPPTPPHHPPPFTQKQLAAASWQQQQRVGELCDWIYARVPVHLGVAKLLEAADFLLSKNQHELAKRKCFVPVAEAGLLEEGFAKGNLSMTDRRRMHVVALFGIARCDATLLAVGLYKLNAVDP